MKPQIFLVPATLILLSGCGQSSPDGAQLCYNAALFDEGNQFTLTSYDGDKPVAQAKFTVAKSTLDGKAVALQKMDNRMLQRPKSPHFYRSNYIEIMPKEFGFKTLKSEIKMDDLEQTILVKNGRWDIFDFEKAGNEKQYPVTIESRSGMGGSSTVTGTDTIRFIGMEKVHVNIGDFDTCHVQYTSHLNMTDGKTRDFVENRWYATKLGVPVKIIAGEDENKRQELTNATINGENVGKF